MLVMLSSLFFTVYAERETAHAEHTGSCSNALLKPSELNVLRNVPQRATVQGPMELLNYVY